MADLSSDTETPHVTGPSLLAIVSPADSARPDKQKLLEVAGRLMAETIEQARTAPVDSPLQAALKLSDGSLNQFVDLMQNNAASIPPALSTLLDDYNDRSARLRKTDEEWWKRFIENANRSFYQAQADDIRQEREIAQRQAEHVKSQLPFSQETSAYIKDLYKKAEFKEISEKDWMKATTFELDPEFTTAFDQLEKIQKDLSEKTADWMKGNLGNEKLMRAAALPADAMTPEKIKELGLSEDDLKRLSQYHQLQDERLRVGERIDALGLSQMKLIEADEAARAGHQEKADELRKQAHEIYKVATSKEQLSRDDIRHQLSDLTGTAPDKVFDAVTGAGNDASASTRFNVVASGIWSCNQGMMNRYSQLLEHQSQLDQQASRMQDLGKILLRADAAASPEERDRLYRDYNTGLVELRSGSIGKALGHDLNEGEKNVVVAAQDNRHQSLSTEAAAATIAADTALGRTPKVAHTSPAQSWQTLAGISASGDQEPAAVTLSPLQSAPLASAINQPQAKPPAAAAPS